MQPLQARDEEISTEKWRSLYALAARLYEMAPWKWMSETDVFGVELPGREVFFVSVMGELGEHLALVVYPGIAELTGFGGFKIRKARRSPTKSSKSPNSIFPSSPPNLI